MFSRYGIVPMGCMMVGFNNSRQNNNGMSMVNYYGDNKIYFPYNTITTLSGSSPRRPLP